MPRRPPGEGRHVRHNTKFWALAAVLLPILPLVEAARNEPPLQHSVIRNSAATALTHEHDLIETPPAAVQRKSTYTRSIKEDLHEQLHGQTNLQPYDNIIIHDASAISAAALDVDVDETETSVRAPPLLTPARSLEDWEVEDFVLLATIDGDLYASDRRTGKERWHISLGQSMVETKHHRRDKVVVESDSNTIWDQTIWAVEPNGDGEIYMWTPGHTGGLMSTGLSMKALVEKMSPYENKDFSLVYTGEKKTNVLTLDAATGRAIRWFGPNASGANDIDSCPRPLDPVASADAEECHSGTITLGRTEYTVGISNPRGYPVATLKYSEWSPNIKDEDLMRQYSTTMDKIYVTSRHDGRVYGFDFERDADRRQSFVEQFPTPIARAFDIMRPARRYSAPEAGDSNLQLTALPQPPLPAKDEQEALLRTGTVFLDQVDGNWYAMSARTYPLITKAPVAPINRLDGLWGDEISSAQLSEALVGQHFVGKSWRKPQIPLLPGSSDSAPQLPQLDAPSQDEPDIPTLAIDAPSPSSTVIERVKKLPQDAANSVIEAFTNPFVASLLMIALFAYRHEIIRRAKRSRKQSVRWAKGVLKQRGFQIELDDDSSDEASELQVGDDDQVPEKAETDLDKASADVLLLGDKPAQDPAAATAVDTEVAVPVDAKIQTGQLDAAQGPPEKKKKAHRGRRGGKMHKKKKAENGSADDEQLNEVEEAVKYAKNLGEPARGPEPDIQTVPDDVGNVSIPILIIDDSLEVIQEQQLGTGSNGTVVFAGKWQDRPVAVKRMLRSFYDIASRETRLLREVDRHDNVIQYYAQLERGDFIYIALELCEASLADVVEKPSHFRALAEAGSKDPLRVLKQITRGLDHLHSLQIVHRDLKPQNILITMDRKSGRPRILVSDFGLCKKLENGQSSLGATTAHNAGTVGWRAPELLHDDDASSTSGPMLVDANSTHSGNVSSNQQQGDHRRRVTRSIDIFSLGIVFFYVLTQGTHPFDCGGSFMREVNIRKGTYSLDRLEVLGEYQREAKHLIETMISANPKQRPKAREILSHPFFWKPKDRLQFLCDVSDVFEREPRDPPSFELQALEDGAAQVIPNGDFLGRLSKDFVDSLGKQRKYTGSRMLDLLRALRNKKNHYEDMPEALQKKVGSVPEGYLLYWTTRFPDLLLYCWAVVRDLGWAEKERFREYYQPPESD
ncbi:Serine/threonine-protein kinase/endoribonuclease IRE1 [Cytospora mali]|uniref:non-specific serine/threonine protein kinase n=1 Tax=Cytospora mali TaxID=578113 RepID=A0A194VQD6_CYTMA|nr:Serine/threonine-protein kinase/endoribonuclease IRE1 [Valsa mali]